MYTNHNMNSLIKELSGGDFRSPGNAHLIAKRADSKLIVQLIQLLSHEDKLVAFRASDALEKATIKNYWDVLTESKTFILKAFTTDQQEIRWHLAQIAPRVNWSRGDLNVVIGTLENWFNNDKSNIVRVFALQAVFDLSKTYPELDELTNVFVTKALKSGKPSLVSRAKKLKT